MALEQRAGDVRQQKPRIVDPDNVRSNGMQEDVYRPENERSRTGTRDRQKANHTLVPGNRE